MSAWIDRPPCWPEGAQLPNKCAERCHTQHVVGNYDLSGQFAGWKVRRNELVAPNGRRVRVEGLQKFMDRYGVAKRPPRARLDDAQEVEVPGLASTSGLRPQHGRPGCRECAQYGIDSLFLRIEPDLSPVEVESDRALSSEP